MSATAQVSLKLDARQPGLESKIIFHVGQRRIYDLEIAVPDDLTLPEVVLPCGGTWSIEKEPSSKPEAQARKEALPLAGQPKGPAAAPGIPAAQPPKGGTTNILKIHLQQGVAGDAAVILRGKLAAPDERREVSLPRLVALGVQRQEGDIAVQADAAFTVQARDLSGCQETELQRVAAWLDPEFRAVTRMALHYAGGACAGRLRLVPRVPEVVCDTVTNVRVTDRAIEETLILNYGILNAGIRELNFLLPATMAVRGSPRPSCGEKQSSRSIPRPPAAPCGSTWSCKATCSATCGCSWRTTGS